MLVSSVTGKILMFRFATTILFSLLPLAMLAEAPQPQTSTQLRESASPGCSQFLTAKFFSGATGRDVFACLKAGAKVSAVNAEGETALHLAAANTHDPDVIYLLLSSMPGPASVSGLLNQTDGLGRTALHRAAEASNFPEVIRRLIQAGADPNATYAKEDLWFRPDRGVSALHLAAQREDKHRAEILAALLIGGADPFLQTPGHRGRTDGGRTALLIAVQHQASVSTIDLLMTWQKTTLLGGKILKYNDDQGRSPLHIAAEHRGGRRNSDHDLR
jgi:ankyrin repeat protein